MTPTPVPRPIDPTAVERAFGTDRRRTRRGTLLSDDDHGPRVQLAGGAIVRLRLDDAAGFARALARPDLCRRRRRDVVVMVSAYYALVGIAFGRATAPRRLVPDAYAYRASTATLDGYGEQPGWLLFRGEVVDAPADASRRDARAADGAGHAETEATDVSGIGEPVSVATCVQRLAQHEPLRNAVEETFGDLEVLRDVVAGRYVSFDTDEQLCRVVRDVIRQYGTQVLCLSWDGEIPGGDGATWIHEYAGLYVLMSSDVEPQGPFGSLGDATLCESFVTLAPNRMLDSTVLPLDELLAIAEGHVDRENDGTIWVNDVEYRYRAEGDALTPVDSTPTAAEPVDLAATMRPSAPDVTRDAEPPRVGRPLDPATVRRALNDDLHPVGAGRLIGISDDGPIVRLADGSFATLRLENPHGFARALDRSDVSRVPGVPEPAVLASVRHGLVGVPVGPATLPRQVALDGRALRFEGTAVVGLEGSGDQPGWLLFRCEVLPVCGPGSTAVNRRPAADTQGERPVRGPRHIDPDEELAYRRPPKNWRPQS